MAASTSPFEGTADSSTAPLSTLYGRVVGTVTFLGPNGRTLRIPPGPCLIEVSGHTVTLAWGPEAESTAALRLNEYEQRLANGDIELVD